MKEADHTNDWQQRLLLIEDMMRDMSVHTDPQAMVRAYGERIQPLFPVRRRISLSRRGLSFPQYRITRSTTWTEEINPWTEPERLPLFSGGLLADLIYGEKTVVIDDLELQRDEPAHEYLAGHRSVLAIPMFDQGESLNMVLIMHEDAHAFPRESIPDMVWRSNLFGRATSNLVLREEVRQAYKALDRELRIVADIQRSLLPEKLPTIPTLDLATHYQPAHRAGGDYYDFFALPDGQWGIFIGDVSGHGTPAAVLMAVTHAIAHSCVGPHMPPSEMLNYLNEQLSSRYTQQNGTFVTAFYGVYDPARHLLTYSSAGHDAPRLKRCRDGSLLALNQIGGLPLGVLADTRYESAERRLEIGDQILFYTDGITEAQNVRGEMYGIVRLDRELENCALHADALLQSILRSVESFAEGRSADDDRTLIVARVLS
jgi:sigma-B regulation protein RsbU (phosphoserine phosphatase)